MMARLHMVMPLAILSSLILSNLQLRQLKAPYQLLDVAHVIDIFNTPL